MNSDSQTGSLTEDARIAARGLCMGCADVVPGVSGGTVALVLGIYERLVTAISRIDRTFVRLLLSRRLVAAAQHVDFRFLLALAIGILSGFVGMTIVMNKLLTNPNYRMLTLAAFFGMILASTFIVGRWVGARTRAEFAQASVLAIIGAAIALGISLVPQGDAHVQWSPSLGYLFLCGCIGICAMILPGISGAMLLLLLGVYVHLTEIPKNLLKGQDIVVNATELIVFASGCLVTLIFFSKILRWMLVYHRARTMSILTGIMCGALIKVWPYQRDLTPEIEKIKYKRFALEWPATFTSTHLAAIAVIVIAAILVFVVDNYSRKSQVAAA